MNLAVQETLLPNAVNLIHVLATLLHQTWILLSNPAHVEPFLHLLYATESQ